MRRAGGLQHGAGPLDPRRRRAVGDHKRGREQVRTAAAGELARETSRGAAEFEYQMLYGIRDGEQRRLADSGNAVRVYVPFGTQWYGYFVRRLAERPANLTFFLRALRD